MVQTKSVVKDVHHYPHTIGGKLVSVWRQPLFTFPLPVKKKPEPPATAKTVTPEKSKLRPIPANIPHRPVTTRNALPKHKSAAGIFTPARNREEFEKILFVLRACDRYGGRGFTNVLHIERTKNGSRLVATDGKRMHVAEIKSRIKPGDYKPVATKDALRLGTPVPNAQFPNWERVVPTNIVRRGYINLETATARDKNRIQNTFEQLTGERVNPNYLADLTKKPWAVYRQKENRKALLLKESGAIRETYAVIMPLAAA